MSEVYILILNWNGWQDTVACIESCSLLSHANYKILIVDNGSTDGSETILRERFPDTEMIQTGKNLGFAGGNNVGIRHAMEKGARYLWLLNNDTLVEPETLSSLISIAEKDKKAGIIGSKIYYYDQPGKIWFAGGIWRPRPSHPFHIGLDQEDEGQYEDVREVDFVSGCSLLIKSEVVKDIGTMSEDYFLYWEDVDWNASASRKGYKIIYAPKSRVWHKVSASMQNQTLMQLQYSVRNRLLFLQRQAPNCLFPVFAYSIVKIFRHIIHGNTQHAWSYFRGTRDFALRRFGRL